MMAAFCGVGNDPTYTPTSTFETFPFPAGLEPNPPQPPFTEGGSINPASLESPPSIKGDLGGFASAIATAARPAWLDNAHRTLDKAVAAAYNWNDYTPEMPDETILGRLLELNLERAERIKPE